MKHKTPEALARTITTVASLPAVFTRMNVVANNPRSSLADVAEVISQDPGLTIRLLKLVNSAYFGFPAKIDSIVRACVIVGTQQIRNLALGTSVIGAFKKIPVSLLDMPAFWRHSLGCAMAARELAVLSGELDAEHFFVAGLLHDIGRLGMLQTMPDETSGIINTAADEGRLMHLVEKEVLGFTHADAGGALLRIWELPVSLIEPVRCHHAPLCCSGCEREVAITHLANIITHVLGLGDSGDSFIPPLDVYSWKILGLAPSALVTLAEEMEEHFEDTASIFLGDDN